MHRHIYYQVLDTAAEEITKRVEQLNFTNLVRLKHFLLRATSAKTVNTDLDFVDKLFNSDVDNRCLRNQFLILPDLCRPTSNETLFVDSLKVALDTLGKGRGLFSEVIILMIMYYPFPLSSATAAKSFSSMSRLRFYFEF